HRRRQRGAGARRGARASLGQLLRPQPGLIKTNIRANVLGGNQSLRFRVVEWVIGKLNIGPAQYAERIVPLLVSPDLEERSGAMFNQKAIGIQKSAVMSGEHVTRLAGAAFALADRALARVTPPQRRLAVRA